MGRVWIDPTHLVRNALARPSRSVLISGGCSTPNWARSSTANPPNQQGGAANRLPGRLDLPRRPCASSGLHSRASVPECRTSGNASRSALHQLGPGGIHSGSMRPTRRRMTTRYVADFTIIPASINEWFDPCRLVFWYPVLVLYSFVCDRCCPVSGLLEVRLAYPASALRATPRTLFRVSRVDLALQAVAERIRQTQPSRDSWRVAAAGVSGAWGQGFATGQGSCALRGLSRRRPKRSRRGRRTPRLRNPTHVARASRGPSGSAPDRREEVLLIDARRSVCFRHAGAHHIERKCPLPKPRYR